MAKELYKTPFNKDIGDTYSYTLPKTWAQRKVNLSIIIIFLLQDIVGMCTGGVFEHRKKCNLGGWD